jgi:hypothetical protein
MLIQVLRGVLAAGAASALGEGLAVTFDNSDHMAVTHWIFFAVAVVLMLGFGVTFWIERGKRSPEPRIGRAAVVVGGGAEDNEFNIGRISGYEQGIVVQDAAKRNRFSVGIFERGSQEARSLRLRISALVRRWLSRWRS